SRSVGRSADRVGKGNRARSQLRACVLPAWSSTGIPRPTRGSYSLCRESDQAEPARPKFGRIFGGVGCVPSRFRTWESSNRSVEESARRKSSVLVYSLLACRRTRL